MFLPENPQNGLQIDHHRVIDHKNSLGMAGLSRTDLLIGGIGGQASGIADGGVNALQLPEQSLGTPEAAKTENDLGISSRKGGIVGVPRTACGAPFQTGMSRPGKGFPDKGHSDFERIAEQHSCLLTLVRLGFWPGLDFSAQFPSGGRHPPCVQQLADDLQRLDTGQVFSFQPFQKRATSG